MKYNSTQKYSFNNKYEIDVPFKNFGCLTRYNYKYYLDDNTIT